MENNGAMEKVIQLAMENAELRTKLEVLKRVVKTLWGGTNGETG